MGTKSILVVDDDRDMRLAIQETLSRCGYHIALASNGIEAIVKLKEREYQVILADMKMPGMSGLELLKELKYKGIKTPLILITAYGKIEDAVEAMKTGAFDYIQKPFSSEALENLVDKAIRQNDKKPHPGPLLTKGTVITQNSAMLKVIELAQMVAPTRAPILIQGESGTGKEVLAQFIHLHSPRKEHPFIAINCAALPEGLLESELFGHEKGSFTGAITRKVGKFELAQGGTLMLDEISEMNPTLQAKLLRVLQEYEIDRIGGRDPISIDVRVISTTNRDLNEAITEKKFRLDLYYRLNVVSLVIPPLRERPDDIPLLTEYFIQKYSQANGKLIKGISRDALGLLREYSWPGNVRELENIIERAVILCSDDILLPQHIALPFPSSPKIEMTNNGRHCSVKDMEKALILKTLAECGNNRTHAAKALGISIRTLRNKLKEYRLQGNDNGQDG
jgi:DNA-binding NtrC family response regulator